MDSQNLRPFLEHLARKSAEVILPYFESTNLQVDWKSDNTPVTDADKKAEEVLRKEIALAFPDHGIVGEELADTQEDAEYSWVLDPIDGTRAFASGCPLFGTLICLRHRERPVWGAINFPVTNTLYVGNGHSAWCGERLLKVRDTQNLNDCTLLTTDPKAPYSHHSRSGWDALLEATGLYRSWGDCFGYGLIAAGKADIMTDPVLNLWDVAALIPILQGCGATLSDWHGKDPLAPDAQGMVTAHPRHHARIIELLRGT